MTETAPFSAACERNKGSARRPCFAQVAQAYTQLTWQTSDQAHTSA
ncbi:MAG: hypothetical protein P8176_10575 [Gammaproteobacteria bacterium]